MSTKELFFEIGSEELPAGFINPALDRIDELMKEGLSIAGLEFASTRTLGTPRRLAIVVEGLSEAKPATSVEVRGPKKEAAYGEDGKPTKALLGFARGQGVDIEDIEVRGEGKGAQVYAKKQVEAEETINLLPELLGGLVSADLFPKTMRWGSGDESFARPIHWVIALFGGETVAFDSFGIKSGNETYGHRFMAGNAQVAGGKIKVDGFDCYVSALKEAYVIIDPAERKKIIEDGLEKAAKEAKGEVLSDPVLVDEVVNLVEYPVVLRGTFDEEFLELPDEIIINAMRSHQRYFSVTDKEGKLMNSFITVANIEATKAEVVINGNERVLRARLNDAKFYYEQDLKVKLDDFVERLKGVVFQAKLGTSYEKVERFTKLAQDISKLVNHKDTKTIKRAAMLSKADLVSGVVGEFAKLQGVMGSIYAERAGESKEVSEAIYEHYMPIAAGGELPKSEAGAIISIADKLDSIAGCFGVGLVPSGTKDPYALRRAALGIIAIIIDRGFEYPLNDFISAAVDIVGEKLSRDADEVKAEIGEFFKERFKNQLLTEGLSFDAIDAVLSTDWFNVNDAKVRIAALEAFKKNPDSERLTVAFKRVSNILKKAGEVAPKPDSALFVDKEEKELNEVRENIAPEIEALVGAKDYEGAFKKLTSIKEVIDRFFDEVMVMAEDEKLKANRLALLSSVRELYYRIADLSKLQSLEG
jgi:glycyl-tRNA synthetase beta chain